MAMSRERVVCLEGKRWVVVREDMGEGITFDVMSKDDRISFGVRRLEAAQRLWAELEDCVEIVIDGVGVDDE